MAATPVVLSEIQRDTLRQVCDTFAARVDVPDDEAGYFARTASDVGVPDAIEAQFGSGAVPEEQLDGLRALLDALAAESFNEAPQEVREQILHAFMDSGPEPLAGI